MAALTEAKTMRTLFSTVFPATWRCLRPSWPALYAEIRPSSTMSWRNHVLAQTCAFIRQDQVQWVKWRCHANYDLTPGSDLPF